MTDQLLATALAALAVGFAGFALVLPLYLLERLAAWRNSRDRDGVEP